MARKKKTDTTTQNNKEMQDWNRSLGYSSKALKALESGTYDELTNRNVSSMKSDDQVRIANPVPVLKGVNTDNTDLELRFGKARQYQKNMANEAQKYQYNDTLAAANTLDKKDQGYLQRLVDRFGDGDLVRSSLSASKKNEWEQKYGKSIDQIYSDFMADQDNAKMRQGQEHSILSTISSTLGSALSPMTALPSLAANLINPDSDTAKQLEKTRADYSKQRKLLRAGVKENLGDKGDAIYDNATQIGDRMVRNTAGNLLGGKVLGGVLTGLGDADEQMDLLNLRPGMSGRKKAASALAHGTVEGAGTAITTGLLDGLPTVNGIGGRLINIGKGAGNAAIENAISEAIEMGLDTAINGENSEKALNKAIYMMQGMSEADAEKQVKADQWGRVKSAAGTGAIFGGATKGLGEFTDSLRKDKIPSLWTPDNKPVDTSDIDNVIAKATDQAEGAKAEIENLAKQIPETPDVEATKAEPTSAPETPKANTIQPLQGEELEAAQKQVDNNKITITTIDQKIEALKNDPKNLYRGKLKKAVENEIKVLEKQKKELTKANTGLNRQIKGEPTPVKEQLTKQQYNAIYGKTNSITADLYVARRLAGDTPEAKALEKECKALLNEYVNTGDRATLTNFVQKVIELDHMSKEAGGTYKTANSNYTYDDWYNDGTGNIEDLNTRILGSGALEPVTQIHKANAGSVEPTIDNEVPTFKAPEAPTEEIPTEEVPNILPTASNGGAVPPEPPKGPNGPETDISQRYETLKNSDLFQKSQANMKMLETAKQQGVFNKDIEGRAQAQADALKEFTEDPTKAINDNLNKQWSSGKDMDTSMIVLNDALDTGSQAYANLVMLKQAQQVKGAGRVLRAALDYAKKNYAGTKEGTLQEAAKFLNDKAESVLSSRKTAEQFNAIAERIMKGDLSDLNTRFNMDDVNIQNIKDALEAGAGKADIAHMIAMYQSVGKTGISADALQKVTDIYNQIQSQNLEPNSRARANLEADAFKVLAQDIGGKRTFKEQWDAWRYLAMLGNPKTHLRNILGNTTHYMVTEAKDNIGAVMEAALDKANKATGGEGIERTKAVLNANDKGLVKAGELDADNVAYAALNDSGSKYNVKSEIDRARQAFNNKVLSKIDGLNSNLLDVEDYSALKRKYSKSLARYLKANGADESIFKATDDASKALLDKARAYAIDQAKQATFHEYSKTAAMLSRFSNDMANSDKLHHKAASYMLEGVLPFKKTPINILKQGGKYSPISLATGLKKAFDAVQTGNSTAAEAIEDLSAGLTGTGIMGLGMFLANQGFLTGSANPDYTVDQAETEQGAQNYALKIGDNSYTLDWLAPMSLPLFVGVELNRLMNEDDDEGLTLNKAISALSTIAEPITEMSMLQGINDVLEKLSYDPAGALAGLATQTGLGYITQGVPTVAGQFARAIDDTRRSTYSENTGMEKSLDQAMMKVQNKIPFLSQSSQPYVTASGQEQQNEGLASYWLGDNFGTRLMDQMLSPGYFKEGTISDTDKELNRLYEATGEVPYKNVLKGEVDGQKLGKESFTSYQKLYGSNVDYLYDEIIKSDEYNNLDDAEKVKTLKNIREKSKMIADHEIGGKALEKSDQKIYDIYKSKGKDGLLQYIKDKTMADSLDMKYDDYVKKESENPGGAMQWAEDKQTAADMGFTKKDGTVDIQGYEDAVEMFGNNVPAIQSYKEYKSHGFTKNAEKVPYLMDNNAFTDEEKGKILAGSKTYDDLGKTAKGAYDIEGYAGLYYFYLLKQLADTDGNGSIKKGERDALLNSDNPYVTALSDDMYYYLAGQSW